MKMTLHGKRKLEQTLRNLKGAMREELQKTIHATALKVQTTAIKKIQRGPKTGVIYYRIRGSKYLTIRAGDEEGPPVAFVGGAGSHNLSKTHQASRPYEAPATDTGGLASSIAIVLGDSKAKVGTGLVYARYLEFGTRMMQPRPFLYPALQEHTKSYREALRDLAQRAASRAQQ